VTTYVISTFLLLFHRHMFQYLWPISLMQLYAGLPTDHQRCSSKYFLYPWTRSLWPILCLARWIRVAIG